MWRFNGLIISVVGILAMGALLLGIFQIFKEVTRDRNTQHVVNIEKSSDSNENWRLGNFISLKGHNTLMIPLNSDQDIDRGYFSKSSNSTRNYLFIDTETNSNKWLFEHTNYLIENAQQLRVGDNYNSPEPVLAILYKLVKLDSNNDGLLSPSDKLTVAISRPDGSHYQEVFSKDEEIIDSYMLSKDELFIMFQASGKYYSSKLNLSTFVLSAKLELPEIGE